MSRLRTIYNNESLFVGVSPCTTGDTSLNTKKINRVQSIGNSFEYALENINEYGKMAAIDRVNLDGSTSSMEFSYYLTDFENESNLGFTINSSVSAIGNIANKTQDDRNYYRFVAPEGLDAANLSPDSGAVIAVGNGYLASYSLDAAIGSFPTVSISVQGLNTASYSSAVAQQTPAVIPETGVKATGTFTLGTQVTGAGIPVSFGSDEKGIILTNISASDITIVESEYTGSSYTTVSDIGNNTLNIYKSTLARMSVSGIFPTIPILKHVGQIDSRNVYSSDGVLSTDPRPNVGVLYNNGTFWRLVHWDGSLQQDFYREANNLDTFPTNISNWGAEGAGSGTPVISALASSASQVAQAFGNDVPNLVLASFPFGKIGSDTFDYTGSQLLSHGELLYSAVAKPSVIKPGDVKISFSNPNAAVFQSLDSSINIQKANVKFDFKLTPVQKLGSRLAVSREIQYPIDIQIGVESLMGDLTANTGLVDFICTSPTTDITLDFYKGGCDYSGPTSNPSDIFAKIIVKNAKLTSQDLNGSIGPTNTVSMQFLSQIGAANDGINGIFFSGVTGYNGPNGVSGMYSS